MTARVNDYTLDINSEIDRRVGDYTHKWTTWLANPIRTGNGRVKICVSQLELANTYYPFTAQDSYFWWEEKTVLQTPVQIETERTYNTPNDLITELNTKIVAYNIVFSYDATTGKITITNNGANDIRPVGSYRWSDSLSSVYGNICDRLGMTDDTSAITITSGGTYEFPSIVKMLRTNCLYLCCPNLSAMSIQSRIPSPYNNNFVLARASSANWGMLSQLQYSDNIFFYTNEKYIDHLEFVLFDSQFTEVELLESAITFRLHIIVE